MFSRAFIIIAFIATTVMSASVQSTCDDGTPGYTHIVAAKDTCSDIAAEGGISVSRLEDANPNIDCDNLHVGNRLCVPRNTAAPSLTPSHTANSTGSETASPSSV